MQKINFQNLPNQTTPISAQNLNAIQTNAENAIKEVTNVELLAVTNTPPAQCSIGDKYYNTTTKKIYVATDTNTWSVTGENPISGIFYLVFDEQSSYSWDGTDLISVGGGSGITVHDSYSESTTEPYSANYVNNNSLNVHDSYSESTTEPYSANYVNNAIPTLSNQYGTSQTNGYTQDFTNFLVAGNVLYNNDFGTTSNITLSDSTENYDYIEIFFGYDATTTYTRNSIKVYSPNGKRASAILSLSGGTAVYFVLVGLNISGSSITFNNNREISITSGGSITFDTDRQISVFRVIGYNKPSN